MYSPPIDRNYRHGIVLPVVLIFLVVMMLLGVTAIRNVTLEEKMAANVRNQNLAFQAAEQALRACETMVLRGQFDQFRLQAAGPVTAPDGEQRNLWEIPGNWADTSTISAAVAVSQAETDIQSRVGSPLVGNRPRCMVELMDKVVSKLNPSEQKDQVRITARGVGANTNAVVMLQSYLILM